jgi:3-oxo-5-alpha-steroid 4-dehydrogenase 3 / polyprenol reductase
MDWVWTIPSAWAILTAAAILSGFLPQPFRGCTLHGKMNQRKSRLLVPKQWFYHFYVFSVLMNVAWMGGMSITRSLLVLHCFRRLLEQFFWFPCQTTSKMHSSAYVLGYVFYTLVAYSIPETPYSSILWLLGNIIQYTAHRDLYHNRLHAGADGKKSPPKTLLFRFMNCPHYFAEMLIYVSLTSLISWSSIMCTVFVIVSLSVNWRNQSVWYRLVRRIH